MTSRLGRWPVVLALTVALMSGCAVLGAQTYPGACSGLGLSARRCAAVVSRAMDETAVDRASVGAIELTTDPETAGKCCGETFIVRLHTADGRVLQDRVVCGGIMGAYDPACGEDARIDISPSIDYDVTCPGNPPGNCQTLPPTPPPDLASNATPLRLAALDIVIDHPGHYEQLIGKATLPDGYLTEEGLRLVDDQPTTFWIETGRLTIRPDIAGRPPIGSRYRDPYDGLEPVSVFLEFDVIRYSSSGVLQIRDVVVR